ncbi:hypothetical protein OG21DRAFT_919477 [Imleria badia]|nr:hypothetical protein OG21DRAFT_919477 [Imleria badia]
MHPALQIQDILLNIFGHFHPQETASDLPALARPCLPTTSTTASDLFTLARTCRTFKEPALDVLWEELLDPSPLARCLPEASHYSQTASRGDDKRYSFTRPPTQVEWGILRNYTRRIRSMHHGRDNLEWESVGNFLNPPATEPLFPNLRHLHASGLLALASETKIKHLLSMPFPSLISLLVGFSHENQDVVRGSLESLFKFSQNLRNLIIYASRPDIKFINFFSSYVCQWGDLNSVDCPGIPFGVEALVHLSRMPALTILSFTPTVTLPPSDSPLLFPNLRYLTLCSKLLDPIFLTLSRIQLPAITHVITQVNSCPSKQGFSSFLTSVRASVIDHTLQELRCTDTFGMQITAIVGMHLEHPRPVLGFEDLQPCMAFTNLRRLVFDFAWDVNLTDSELLVLASAWPHLEQFSIISAYGWNTSDGITPDGLVQLLQTCPSLREVALAIDTRGYTEFRESPASLGSTFPRTLSIHVIDSPIEAESVPAVAALLASIARSPYPSFLAGSSNFRRHRYRNYWFDVHRRANAILSQRSTTVIYSAGNPSGPS